MTQKMLEAIGAAWPLTERDAGEYARMDVAGMVFTARCFDARGLGNVSVMHGEMASVFQMDTVIVNPFERDMPLFSYDRIYAGGKDTLYLELYDTRLAHVPDTAALKALAAEYADLKDSSVASAWYDDILFKESVFKAAPAEQTPRMDTLAERYLRAYLALCAAAPACDPEQKRRAAAAYTEGLLEHGGASTDNFLKAKGKEFTQGLFRRVLFGTGEV